MTRLSVQLVIPIHLRRVGTIISPTHILSWTGKHRASSNARRVRIAQRRPLREWRRVIGENGSDTVRTIAISQGCSGEPP